jgi:hypothetical protein
MDLGNIISLSLLSPMVLAFVLGIIATLLQSDLDIPDQVYTIITVYLFFAIGLKGGFDLARSPLTNFWGAIIITLGMGAGISAWGYFILRKFGKMSVSDSAAIAMHYSAASSVTLSACITLLNNLNEPFEGFMPTMYTFMELAGILMALYIATSRLGNSGGMTQLQVMKSALSGKGFLLLGGGVLIGLISGEQGYKSVSPFFVDLFPGVLSLFLLEMGMSVGKQLKSLRQMPPFLIIFAMVMPLIHGTITLLLCRVVGLSMGGAIVLATIAASSSYITAPATARARLPEAKPIYYLTMSLVITFPFNLMVGLPIYIQLANLIYGL